MRWDERLTKPNVFEEDEMANARFARETFGDECAAEDCPYEQEGATGLCADHGKNRLSPLESFIVVLAAYCSHAEIVRLRKFFQQWEKEIPSGDERLTKE